MTERLVYSKHTPQDRCGIAFFSGQLAEHLSARHVHSFREFGKCSEFFINMDILELNEQEVISLLKFVKSEAPECSILLLHDYRFSYLEDELIEACDLVVNLSGEPAVSNIVGEKVIQTPVPASSDRPIIGLTKTNAKPTSLAFGFFSPRKKSFKTYVNFYEYMLQEYPDWYHIVVASAHSGDDSHDRESLFRVLDSEAILFLDFLPSQMLTELVSVTDLGVCFYPTGIMVNNGAPASFFAQGKPVITTYGELTPDDYRSFTLDADHLDDIDLSNMNRLADLGANALDYYRQNLTWERLLSEIHSALAGLEASR